MNFNADDIVLVMCLPTNKNRVILSRKEMKRSRVREKYFSRNGSISLDMLEKKIIEVISDKTNPAPASDVVALLVMYLFTTILFPNASSSVPIQLFHHVDDLDTLWEYSWGKAVYTMMFDAIPKCAAWVRYMDQKNAGADDDEEDGPSTQGSGQDGAGEIDGEQPAKKKKVAPSLDKACLPGCAIALMTWFYEDLDFVHFENAEGCIPRFLNWKFTEVATRKSFANHLDALPVSNVKNIPLEATAEEKEFKGVGFKAKSYVECMKNPKLMTMYKVKKLARLLAEMSPVYLLFGFDVAEEIYRKVPAKRFLQLNYAGLKPDEPVAGENRTFTEILCSAISKFEWEHGYHAKVDENEEKSDGASNKKKKGKKVETPPSPPPAPIKQFKFDYVSPVFGKLPADAKCSPSILDSHGINYNLDFDESIEEINEERVNNLQPHELIMESVNYRTFAKYFLANEGAPDLVYKRKSRTNCIERSIFHDPSGFPMTQIDKKINYIGRTTVGHGVSAILDQWWSMYNSKEIVDATTVYNDGKFSCRAMDIIEILKGKWASADFVGCVVHLIQKSTPTNIPWIFINPYVISTIHHVPYAKLKDSHPFLFNKQFEKSKLLIVPLVDGTHWLLLVVDLSKKTWTMYNSLAHGTRQNLYLNYHRMFFAWLRRFLNWRTESRDWDCVQVVWEGNIPKQVNGDDCGLFVIRYVHYIVSEDPMSFDKDDIPKDRYIIAYKLLMDPENDKKFDPKKDYQKKP